MPPRTNFLILAFAPDARATQRPYANCRRGITAIYAIIILTMLTGFASFAVDWGRIQMVKTQLLRAADASARAAASQISSGVTTVQNTAVTWAGNNTADGTSVVIDGTNDVDFGTWVPASRTFTVLTGSARTGANAIRVWARRTAAKGNATPLTFASVIGRNTCDINTSAIAYAVPSSAGYGFVGLNSVALQTNTILTDSYSAASGAYSAGSAGTSGYVASNGGITLNGTVTVKQDLYMKAGQTLSTSGTVSYGSRQVLSSSIVWPTPSAGSYATTNSNGNFGLPANGANASFSSGSVTVPSGNYYLDSFYMSGGTITVSGTVTIYMNGNFNVSGGTFVISSGKPSDLTIKMVTSAGFTISGGSDFYGDVQCPTSPVTIGGISNVYGRVVGSSLTVNGSCKLHYDTSLPAVSGASTAPGAAGSGTIQSVR